MTFASQRRREHAELLLCHSQKFWLQLLADGASPDYSLQNRG